MKMKWYKPSVREYLVSDLIKEIRVKANSLGEGCGSISSGCMGALVMPPSTGGGDGNSSGIGNDYVCLLLALCYDALHCDVLPIL